MTFSWMRHTNTEFIATAGAVKWPKFVSVRERERVRKWARVCEWRIMIVIIVAIIFVQLRAYHQAAYVWNVERMDRWEGQREQMYCIVRIYVCICIISVMRKRIIFLNEWMNGEFVTDGIYIYSTNWDEMDRHWFV